MRLLEQVGENKTSEGMFYAAERCGDRLRGATQPDEARLGAGWRRALAADTHRMFMWLARSERRPRGEDKRQVWVARSSDGGKSFSEDGPAWDEATGACACCSTRAFADSRNSFYMLYRSANDSVNRDMYLLSSSAQGKTIQGKLIHKWKVPG